MIKKTSKTLEVVHDFMRKHKRIPLVSELMPILDMSKHAVFRHLRELGKERKLVYESDTIVSCNVPLESDTKESGIDWLNVKLV